MSFRIVRAEATPALVTVTFSEEVGARGSYKVESPIGGESRTISGNSVVVNTADNHQVKLTIPTSFIQPGQWVKITASGVNSKTPTNTPGRLLALNGDIAYALTPFAASSTFSDAINELLGYPLQTTGGGAHMPASAIPGTATLGSLQMVIDRTLRNVLGRAPQPSNPQSFMQALTQTFSAEQVDGHVEWKVSPRTFAGQSDLGGGITGAQASLVLFANNALEQSLPLIDTVFTLDPNADEQEVEAARSILRSEWEEFIEELETEGGPRSARADDLIERILIFHLPEFGIRLGMVPANISVPLIPPGAPFTPATYSLPVSRDKVITLEEEENLTSFISLRDYIVSVYASWSNYKAPQAQGDLGSGLVLLSRRLSVVAESVNETYGALDSVYVGPAERLATRVDLGTSYKPMVVEEILSWITEFAAEQAPRLIQEGGLRGVSSIIPTLIKLEDIIGRLINKLGTLPKGFQHPRVKNTLNELLAYLEEARIEAGNMLP